MIEIDKKVLLALIETIMILQLLSYKSGLYD